MTVLVGDTPQANWWGATAPAAPEQPVGFGPYVVFDLDSTICDTRHRRHFLEGENPDWEAFHNACDGDPTFRHIERLWRMYTDAAGLTVMVFTGRPESVRGKTERWLDNHGLHYETVYMRPDGDWSTASELKYQMLLDAFVDEETAVNAVEIAIDDDASVGRMFRDVGIGAVQPWPFP